MIVTQLCFIVYPGEYNDVVLNLGLFLDSDGSY